MRIHIRNAEIEDAREVSRVLAESWRSTYANLIHEEYLAGLPDDHWVNFLEEAIDSESAECLIAEAKKKIIGAAVFRKSQMAQFLDDAELVCLYFLPEATGKGAGSKLLHFAQEEMFARGYEHCVLDVLQGNQRAKTFYERNGFKKERYIENVTLGSQTLVCEVFRKKLEEPRKK